MLFVNRGLTHADPYRRYLEGSLRESLGFEGVPIRLVLRRKPDR
jgi:predicted GTPase